MVFPNINVKLTAVKPVVWIILFAQFYSCNPNFFICASSCFKVFCLAISNYKKLVGKSFFKVFLTIYFFADN